MRRLLKFIERKANFMQISGMFIARFSLASYVNMDDTESLGRVNDMYEDDYETRDFDDLVFALKTGGQYDQEPTRDDEKEPERDISGQEHYGLRRISIADTHL